MRLSLESLQVLDAIERRGSFSGAAQELNRVPSAITYSIQQLEQDLDTAVFDRSGHRAKLTEAGAELLREGRHLLRAAAELERRIRQVAKGWEVELRIAIDMIVGTERLFPMLGAFYAQNPGTRVKLLDEVLGGGWDALASGRADLVIGATGDLPPGGGFASRPMGASVRFVFVAAPGHPLCAAPLPLSEASILAHRAVSVADSSRNLPARTVGLLSGQDVLTVPTLDAKIAAHVAGLGVGFLPESIAVAEVAAGRLVMLEVQAAKPPEPAIIAWRPGNGGKALKWFLKQLAQPGAAEALLP
jgi:DNA-binding transcriptional LysR family regulator